MDIDIAITNNIALEDINKKIEKKVIESLNNPKAFVGYLGITKSGSVTLSTRKTVRYNRRTE